MNLEDRGEYKCELHGYELIIFIDRKKFLNLLNRFSKVEVNALCPKYIEYVF